MSDPRTEKDLKGWQFILVIVAGIVVVVLGLTFIFGGSGDDEESSNQQTESPQIQQPSDQPTSEESSMPDDPSTTEEDNAGVNDQDNGGTEGKAEAEEFMKIMNEGGKGDDLKKKLKNTASSAFLASLHGVPDKAIPAAGEKVAMADAADDGSKIALIKDEDGNDIYSVSLNKYKVKGQDKYLVDALDLLDDGSHAATDKDGKPVRIDVMPLFQDSKRSMSDTAITVVRNYVEFDAQESAKERDNRVKEQFSGKKEYPEFRLENLGTEAKVRMYSPENVRFLNESSGDKTDSNKISIGMTVKSANLSAGEEVIDTFDAVVDYTWNKNTKMWEPSAIRVV